MDILIGVIASLIAAIIIFIFKHWTGHFFSDFKARVASSIENGNNGSNRDNITENTLRNISPLLMKINCSRCNTINPLANNDCSNCGNKDIARQKIVDRGFLKSIILAVISVIIFPLNLLFGILSLLIILKAYIYSNIAGFFIPIIVLGKVFSFFEKTPWSYVGLASVGFLISGIIIVTLEYAIENENSIPQRILRFMLMFLFPPLFILIYLNYYEPRSALENISREVKKNLNKQVSEDDAKKILMAKYKKRDSALGDIAKVVSDSEDSKYHFSNDYLYKYFSDGAYKNVVTSYGIIILIYIFSFLYYIGLFNV